MMLKSYFTIFRITFPTLVILAIWGQLANHYYVPGIDVSETVLKATRSSPNDSTLFEVEDFIVGQYTSQLARTKNRTIALAEGILLGEFGGSGKQRKAVNIQFTPSDLDQAKADGWNLEFATFTVPQVLLVAYELTNREEFLIAARDFILSWAEHEIAAWFPRALLWNDHALSARVGTLAMFWRLYRQHPAYQPEDARKILKLVGETGQRLAKKSLFTFRTNHGIMQNLALLQIRLAFPALPGNQKFETLAIERLHDQLKFYINDEGIILEHSAGYQEFGMTLIAEILRSSAMLGLSIPDSWALKYRESINYYAMLRRPDGSLPIVGDTLDRQGLGPNAVDITADGGISAIRPHRNPKPPRSSAVYPAAGYAIWWDGLKRWPLQQGLSQTVMAWANFPARSHKHADELNINLWADGLNWWRGAGYVPYGNRHRNKAMAWPGSNAPHLIGEPRNSTRNSQLTGQAKAPSFEMLDIERKGPNGFAVRRQILHLERSIWLIIDSFVDQQNRRTQSIWVSDPRITAQSLGGNAFRLEGPDRRRTLQAYFLGSPNPLVSNLRGRESPDANWVEAMGKQVVQANTFVVEQQSNAAWTANLSILEQENAPQITGSPKMTLWRNAEDWRFLIPTVEGEIQIWRDGENIQIVDAVGRIKIHAKIRSEEPNNKIALASLTAYRQGADKYKRGTNDFIVYRWRMTFILLAFFVLQEFLMFLLRRRRAPYPRTLSGLLIASWSGGGIWLLTVYFSV